MISEGERLKILLKGAQKQILLCSPFIKANVLETILFVVPDSIPVRIVTRWRANEIAMGISDLEVFDLANNRPKTQLELLNNLHAKLYLADDDCLVGSANLTGVALGWSIQNNIEILVPARTTDPDIASLLEQLDCAVLATSKTRAEVEAVAASFELAKFFKTEKLANGNNVFVWLPSCAAPDKLYEIYRDRWTDVVAKGTREDGVADLKNLLIKNGLSRAEFKSAMQDALLMMPAIASIAERVSRGITNQVGFKLIERVRPDLTEQDVEKQWRIVKDWLSVFFENDMH